MELFDTHSHYNDEKFNEDREVIISETFKFGVTRFMCIGYDLESSRKAIKIAEEHDNIWATCGISPNDIDGLDFECLKELELMAKNPKVVAIGEIGLEYYWEKNEDMRLKQKDFFIKQIEIANRLDLPIVIHTRDAVMDTLNILKENDISGINVTLHCFSESIEMAREFLKLGCKFGVGGVVTFKNGRKLQEVVSELDLSNFILETDSPYLTPEPYRGTKNEPKNVFLVAEKIGKIKNMSTEDVINITTKTSISHYNLEV